MDTAQITESSATSTKDFFDSVAQNWDNICRHDQRKLDMIFEQIGVFKGAKVLDVGCGTGILIPRIFDAIGEEGSLVAVDYSEKMLKIAKSKHKFSNLKFLCDDISCVKFKENHFDFIICYSVFPHFTDKKKTLTHLVKALKIGGKLCIAHSEAREAINQMHEKTNAAVAGHKLLPANEVVAVVEEIGLRHVFSIDNECLYQVIAEKI